MRASRGRLLAALLTLFVVAGSVPALAQEVPPTDPNADVEPPPPDQSEGIEVPATSIPTGFEDQLAPYGTWQNLPTWGWCWIPNTAYVGADFRPYVTGGQWAYTTQGWEFTTTWPWGSVPFHYGRWFWDPTYRWVWLPGSVWGPAWVDWHSGGGYVGWAPLPPPGYVWRVPAHFAWSFVEGPHLGEPDLAGRVIVGPRVRDVYHGGAPDRQVAVVDGAHWRTGPHPVSVVQRPEFNAHPMPSARPAQIHVTRVAPRSGHR